MSATASPGGFAARLRNDCRALHARLDAHPAIASLATPQPRLADYRCLLATMGGLVPALERALGEALPRCGLAGWLPALNRAAPLAHDCDELAIAPRRWPLPLLLADRHACAAALYVLEGARLGGRLMARNLQRSPTLAHLPVRFLSTAAPVSLGWPALLDWLAAQEQESAAASAACGVACGLFAGLLEAFDAACAAAPREALA